MKSQVPKTNIMKSDTFNLSNNKQESAEYPVIEIWE